MNQRLKGAPIVKREADNAKTTEERGMHIKLSLVMVSFSNPGALAIVGACSRCPSPCSGRWADFVYSHGHVSLRCSEDDLSTA